MACGQWAGVVASGALIVTAAIPAGALCAPALREAPRSTPSGQPVPRYVSTRFGVVNARAGPGDDYRLLWVYRALGLPLQVIAETDEWRRVCDPEGGVAWVHRRTVGDARRVMRVQPKPLTLRSAPDEDARVTAVLAGRALATLRDCRHGWCRVAVDHAGGWARQEELWGTLDASQCGSPVAGANPRAKPREGRSG